MILLAGLVLAAAPCSAQAQGPARAIPGASPELLQATAELRPTEPIAPLDATEPANAMVMVASGHTHHGEAVALMVVGAAGIITGLAVDEPVITIAGAVAGGIGLYLYLR
jgi:predicted component of type VI protein secretion system